MTQSPNTNILVDLYFFLRGLIETAEWFNKDVLSCPPQGGDLMCEEQVSGPPPLLLQWVKTDHALVMLFNNGTLQVRNGSWIFFLFSLCYGLSCESEIWIPILVTLVSDYGSLSYIVFVFNPLQVNFYTDHTKIILCKSSDDSYLLTYISRERVSCTYLLSMLIEMGCTSELRHRLRYVVQLLQHHADAWEHSSVPPRLPDRQMPSRLPDWLTSFSF